MRISSNLKFKRKTNKHNLNWFLVLFCIEILDWFLDGITHLVGNSIREIGCERCKYQRYANCFTNTFETLEKLFASSTAPILVVAPGNLPILVGNNKSFSWQIFRGSIFFANINIFIQCREHVVNFTYLVTFILKITKQNKPSRFGTLNILQGL